MTISMYQASVPVLTRTLKALRGVLAKAEAHVGAKKLDETALTTFRLYPDMFPLSRQVQIASDMAKGVARLAGIDPPAYEDNEKTFAELMARIDKTVEFLNTLQAAQIDGSETRVVTLKMRTGSMDFQGQDYLLGFVLPNVYFHCTTAYNILRHNGVEIGKRDFLGG